MGVTRAVPAPLADAARANGPSTTFDEVTQRRRRSHPPRLAPCGRASFDEIVTAFERELTRVLVCLLSV
jgi:hypothetical protein